MLRCVMFLKVGLYGLSWSCQLPYYGVIQRFKLKSFKELSQAVCKWNESQFMYLSAGSETSDTINGQNKRKDSRKLIDKRLKVQLCLTK